MVTLARGRFRYPVRASALPVFLPPSFRKQPDRADHDYAQDKSEPLQESLARLMLEIEYSDGDECHDET
jgi:hypothetical protein